jgi:PAS domain-containing protein
MRLAPEAIVVLDVDQGRFVDFNENALRLFKLDRDRLSSATFVELSPQQQPSEQSSVVAASGVIDRAVRGETPIFDWVHRDRYGEHVPCEIRLVRLPGADRRLIWGSVIDAIISPQKAKRQSEDRVKFDKDTPASRGGVIERPFVVFIRLPVIQSLSADITTRILIEIPVGRRLSPPGIWRPSTQSTGDNVNNEV